MNNDVEIREVMTPWAFWIGAKQAASMARELMTRYGIRHLPVLEGEKVVGILSERDLSLALAWEHHKQGDFIVEEICVPDPYIVAPHTPLSEVLECMVAERCDCALIMENRKLIGIFTATDACRVLGLYIAGAPITHKAA